MAVEPWNKINITYPGAAAACRIVFTNRTAAVTEAVVVHCGNVLKLLDSHVLHTEVRVLHQILYVMNNGLRQHKPFRAIKQVKQCINRLKEMKLQGALQDLQELCPNEIHRNVGVDVGHCDVPSQPMLEWFCLKLLGASRLLCCTMDQCTKAFLLTRQHLYLTEFIVLNLVLLSMLSRLWVFFRGILRTLVPVYQDVMDLLHEVVQCQPMAFLTDFTLPGDLAVFLGPLYSGLIKERTVAEPFRVNKAAKASFLDRLFGGESEEQVEMGGEEEGEIMHILASEDTASNMDLGMTVLRPPCSRSSSNLDMLQQIPKQYTVSPGQPSTSSLALPEQKRMFLKKLKIVSSVKDMAAHLKEMMGWCKKNKLHQERCSLAFTLLRCQRIKALECEGISVQRKLRRLRLSVHHVMLKDTSVARPSHFPQQKTKCNFRTSFATLFRLYGSVRTRFVRTRMQSRIAKDLFNVTSSKCRKYTRVPPLYKDMSGKDFVISQKESKMQSETNSLKSGILHDDEIDNIFASFGL